MLNQVSQVDDNIRVRRALISVSDKTGLVAFALELWNLLPDLIVYSTGGTFATLAEIAPKGRLVQISEYTGQPEMQGGLVKTLDFKIYLGLLSETYNKEHSKDLDRTGAVPFDLVVVNLYPFAEVVSDSEATLENARANIDIGGPCMLRASAKNFLRVASVCDPADYPQVISSLKQSKGSLSMDFRFWLAKKTFQRTAAYDELISSWLLKDETVLMNLYRFQKEERTNE